MCPSDDTKKTSSVPGDLLTGQGGVCDEVPSIGTQPSQPVFGAQEAAKTRQSVPTVKISRRSVDGLTAVT